MTTQLERIELVEAALELLAPCANRIDALRRELRILTADPNNGDPNNGDMNSLAGGGAA